MCAATINRPHVSNRCGAGKPSAARRSVKAKSDTIIVAGDCHPQTIDVIRTRAEPLGLKVLVGFAPKLMQDNDCFAVLAQYPSTTGQIHDLAPWAAQARPSGSLACRLKP